MSLRPAAFFRVEGVLLPPHTLRCALYLGAATPGIPERLARWGGWLASAPLAAGFALADRRRLRRLAGYHLRGLSRDRIEALGTEYFDRFLASELHPGGLELLKRARADGKAIVLCSRGLRAALDPLCQELQAEHLVASELEFRDGVATGQIMEPDSSWASDWAAEAGVSLPGSFGYGADLADLELLEAVGYPCAVNPDLGLRRRARAANWPVLDLGREVHA
ncbi:MAG: haloacid dehalogenase-like hydrolase [Planctomycetes bacterium]|nr:haloacid dehalogenase-like hydrolase [Planctomycetota bacterium]